MEENLSSRACHRQNSDTLVKFTFARQQIWNIGRMTSISNKEYLLEGNIYNESLKSLVTYNPLFSMQLFSLSDFNHEQKMIMTKNSPSILNVDQGDLAIDEPITCTIKMSITLVLLRLIFCFPDINSDLTERQLQHFIRASESSP